MAQLAHQGGFGQSHAPCTHNWTCGAEIKSMTKVLERVGNGGNGRGASEGKDSKSKSLVCDISEEKGQGPIKVPHVDQKS